MAETRAIVHIYATHNNTMLLLTDLTGAETIAKATGGMETKAQHKEGSPYVAMKLAENIANAAKEKGMREIFIKVRGHGGNRSPSPGTGAEAAIRSLTRNGLRIVSIENVTPLPHDGCRKQKKFRGKSQK
ncbi:MAG: 30S ribosomal protein S11 [Candidatus Diapherotrites archaeon]|nr:30S ribosomal protein S11 [Candidatus Diapherotrites archaeon]